MGRIILQIALLYIVYFFGSCIQQILHLALPGSLIGLFLLFALLGLKVLPISWFERGGETLVVITPFLLLPSTVGLMNYGSFLLHQGVTLFITIIISTFLIIVFAGHTGQYLANREEKKVS
ncbi:CidA/LrgA family holin-like protein [Microbacteriaceae bacterium 4G12]